MRHALAKKILLLALLSSSGALLSACHTIQGAGEDVSSVGEAGSRATGY